MYVRGENFDFDINGEEHELNVLEIVTLGEAEYLITEDFDGNLFVFLSNENEEEVQLVDDKREARDIIEYWKDEYLLAGSIGDYEEDEYYDREDRDIEDDYDDYDDNYRDYDDDDDY